MTAKAKKSTTKTFKHQFSSGAIVEMSRNENSVAESASDSDTIQSVKNRDPRLKKFQCKSWRIVQLSEPKYRRKKYVKPVEKPIVLKPRVPLDSDTEERLEELAAPKTRVLQDNLYYPYVRQKHEQNRPKTPERTEIYVSEL